jgi:hypothetical protein
VGPERRFRIALQQVPGERINGPFELVVDGETRQVEDFPLGDPEDDEHRSLVYDTDVELRFAFDEPLLVTRARWQVAVGRDEGNARYHHEHHLPYLRWHDDRREPTAGLMNLRAAYNWAVGHVTEGLEFTIHNQLARWELGVPPTRETTFDGIEVLAVPVAAFGDDTVDLRPAYSFKGRGEAGDGIAGPAL